MQGSADETEYLPVGIGPGATVAGVSLNGKPRISRWLAAQREAWLAYPPSSTESRELELKRQAALFVCASFMARTTSGR